MSIIICSHGISNYHENLNYVFFNVLYTLKVFQISIMLMVKAYQKRFYSEIQKLKRLPIKINFIAKISEDQMQEL